MTLQDTGGSAGATRYVRKSMTLAQSGRSAIGHNAPMSAAVPAYSYTATARRRLTGSTLQESRVAGRTLTTYG
jgi:hypothetical protein